MTYAVTAQGDRLEVELEPGTWTRLMELKTTPDIGETAVKVDATNFDSEMREYIKGIPDQADLEFVSNAMPITAPNSNVKILMGMSRNAEYRWRWVSPRLGVQVIWRGEFAYRFGAGAMDAPRDLIVTIIPKTRPIESLISSTWTVTYDANGGSGGPMTDESSPYENGAMVKTKENTFVAPEGKSFVGWNTRADNSGSAYDAGDSFPIYMDTVLYATWSE